MDVAVVPEPGGWRYVSEVFRACWVGWGCWRIRRSPVSALGERMGELSGYTSALWTFALPFTLHPGPVPYRVRVSYASCSAFPPSTDTIGLGASGARLLLLLDLAERVFPVVSLLLLPALFFGIWRFGGRGETVF